METPMPSPYRKILVAFDGSGGAVRALWRALLLAKQQDAEVTTLSVDEHLPRFAPGVGEVAEEERLRAQHFAELRSQVEAVAKEHGKRTRIVIETAAGHAAQTILSFAQEGGYDVIVIGHTGHSGLWGTLLGSTTDRVVGHATCDVLVVR